MGAPPRSDLVRAVFPGIELRAEAGSDDTGLGRLTGHFSVFDTWYEVDSAYEGHFLERIAPGSFTSTMAADRASMRVLLNHGADPQVGDKPLGPIDILREDETGGYYEVPLLDTSYNRDIAPGLRAGVYGSSFRFSVRDEQWQDAPPRATHNPEALPERTITDARVFEFGPVTFPANPSASAGVRSLTDEWRSTRFVRPSPVRIETPDRKKPAPAPVQRFRSRDEWLDYLTQE